MEKLQLLAACMMLALIVPVAQMSNSIESAMAADFSIALERDYWPTTEWLTATPEEKGMNSTLLDELWAVASPLRAFVVVRDGYIVYENYQTPDFGETTLKPVFSVTKSFLSALVGIALEDGNITSLDDTVVDYFTDRAILNLDVDKESITVEHLLSMTSGFEWDPDTDPDSMRSSPDWIQYVLDKPMNSTPGVTFSYNTGNSHLLSAIVNKTTGIPTMDFADTRFFQPLGIPNYEWRMDPQDLVEGGSGLNLTARDMAKLGFLWLNNGSWDGEQIVPSWWVNSSVTKQAPDEQYGYHWRVYPSLDSYYAMGYRDLGQYVWVQPQNDLVVVFSIAGLLSPWQLITSYILPSIIVSEPTTTSTTSTSPTSTTTPTNGETQDLNPLFLGLGVAGAAIVVVLVVYIMRKR